MNSKVKLIFWISVIIVLFTVAAIVFSKKSTIASTASPSPTASAGTNTNTTEDDPVTVPDFTLSDLNGSDVSLSDFKGKIVVINFWAVWCKYCKEEMPDFNELNKTMKNDGDVVFLEIDVNEDKKTVVDYLTKNNIQMNILMDSTGELFADWGLQGLPSTIITNKDGTLYKYFPGLTSKEDVTAAINDIRNNSK